MSPAFHTDIDCVPNCILMHCLFPFSTMHLTGVWNVRYFMHSAHAALLTWQKRAGATRCDFSRHTSGQEMSFKLDHFKDSTYSYKASSVALPAFGVIWGNGLYYCYLKKFKKFIH